MWAAGLAPFSFHSTLTGPDLKEQRSRGPGRGAWDAIPSWDAVSRWRTMSGGSPRILSDSAYVLTSSLADSDEMQTAMEAHPEVKVLVEKAQAGDPLAADALMGAHKERLASFVRTRLGQRLRDRVEVEDAVQETFLRALRSLERFQWQGPDSFFRWLCSVAEFLIRDLARKHSRDDEQPLHRELPTVDASPSKAVRRDERFDRLQDSLASLSPEYREVVSLVCLQGLRVKEAAERMGRTPGAVRNLLLRAMRKLRGSFGDTESLHLPDRSLETGEGSDDG